MLKKLIAVAVVGVVAKVVLEEGRDQRDGAELWAEATDTVEPESLTEAPGPPRGRGATGSAPALQAGG